MRVSLLTLATLVLLSGVAHAAPTANDIALLCKQSYPGKRGIQSFCIKEHRNYYDWIQHLRKRTFNDKKQLAHLNTCVSKNHPNYRKAFDCINAGPSILPFF